VKSVKNFRYVEKTSAECNEDSYLAILHLSRVELHCKLQEKLHLVTWPLVFMYTFYLQWRSQDFFGGRGRLIICDVPWGSRGFGDMFPREQNQGL
jgi:hypothetical protein